MFTIDKTIEIATPLAEVRTAITTESGYRAWFAQDTDFDGKQATFRFAQPTETRSVTFRVDRCDRHGIAMTCLAHENNPDWIGTTLAIELAETPSGTRLHPDPGSRSPEGHSSATVFFCTKYLAVNGR